MICQLHNFDEKGAWDDPCDDLVQRSGRPTATSKRNTRPRLSFRISFSLIFNVMHYLLEKEGYINQSSTSSSRGRCKCPQGSNINNQEAVSSVREVDIMGKRKRKMVYYVPGVPKISYDRREM